jgi:hypothetical protein
MSFQLRVGVISSGSSTSTVPPLPQDDFLVVFSLRKVVDSYDGPLIRVQRESDNTQLDINSDSNGNLDTAAILNFVGASTGRVRVFYDQGPESRNLVQTSFSIMPRIVNAGVLDEEGGRPTLWCSPSGYMDSSVLQTSPLTYERNNDSAYVLGRNIGTTGGGAPFSAQGPTGDSGTSLARHITGGNVQTESTTPAVVGSFGTSDTNRNLWSSHFLWGGVGVAAYEYRKNGVQTSTASTTGTGTANDIRRWFLGRNRGGQNTWNGTFQEVVWYNIKHDQTVRENVEANMSAYWNLSF